MKFTKEKLRQMILEEIEASASPEDEAELGKGKMSAAQAGEIGIERAKQTAAQGVTPQEREAMTNLEKRLMSAAEGGNIVSGRALQLMKLLAKELDKLTK